jgi:ribosomal protein S18 acetylase RimI-like enzyme
MDLRIRPVSGGDTEALMALAVLAWELVFTSFQHVLGAEIYPILYPDWRQRQRDAVSKTCAEGSGMTVLVAEADGVVAGFIAYSVDPVAHSGKMDLLAVHPDYQNRGIGTALNGRVLTEMKARHVHLAVVTTGGDPGHAPAQRSYEKSGYTGLPLVRYYTASQDSVVEPRHAKTHPPLSVFDCSGTPPAVPPGP